MLNSSTKAGRARHVNQRSIPPCFLFVFNSLSYSLMCRVSGRLFSHSSQTKKNSAAASKARGRKRILIVTCPINDNGKRRARLCISSRNALAESIPISKKVSTLAVGKELQLIVVVKEHSFEIPLDCKIIGSFVHRLHPSNISTILLEGSAIYRELIIVPVFPPLPVYADIFTETAAQPNALCARKDSRSELFRTFYYLRYSRYSRMLKRRHSNFH
ncbi:hypothetical protein PRIPAC_81630 [Pristionchus pacificus]|uniref:Uncharacterized protein n=1 Tax=Pristionchus pacificus TaxID=54126 RepID=A0A2A6CJM9_PRIPA|nr:hypothetical protein PRIPAC_81160 [Pristionchus pacificus]KAF8375201.1 hypothetical protein PRIPAC_81630 [Pristionchus pacificus]|eukprot:PDM78287.1 hypothetical protein PRIPAC_30866 [Pristionchus pacificus]